MNIDFIEDSKYVVLTDLPPKSLASLIRFIRKNRLGRVKRFGRRHHRQYFIEPINPSEMTPEGRKLMGVLEERQPLGVPR